MDFQDSDCGFERRKQNEQTTFDDERSDQDRGHVEQWMQLCRDRKSCWQKQVDHLTGGAEPLHREKTRSLQPKVQRLWTEIGLPEVRGMRQGALRQEDLFELQALVRPFPSKATGRRSVNIHLDFSQ